MEAISMFDSLAQSGVRDMILSSNEFGKPILCPLLGPPGHPQRKASESPAERRPVWSSVSPTGPTAAGTLFSYDPIDPPIDLTLETLMKVRLKSWEWMDSVERETQLKKERGLKTDSRDPLGKRLRVRWRMGPQGGEEVLKDTVGGFCRDAK